jgi:hypothetical protein
MAAAEKEEAKRRKEAERLAAEAKNANAAQHTGEDL